MPRGMGGVNSFLERVNPFYIVHFELAWNSRERIPKVYKNLEKVSVSVSILRPMAVSISVSNSKLEKKSLNLGLEVETLKKKSQSQSHCWDCKKKVSVSVSKLRLNKRKSRSRSRDCKPSLADLWDTPFFSNHVMYLFHSPSITLKHLYAYPMSIIDMKLTSLCYYWWTVSNNFTG